MKKKFTNTGKKVAILFISVGFLNLVLFLILYARIENNEQKFHAILDSIYKNESLVSGANDDSNSLSLINEHAHLGFENSRETLILLFFILTGVALFVYYLIVKWVLNPIKLIMNYFETGSIKPIKILKTIPGVFGTIGFYLQNKINDNYELAHAKIKAEEGEYLKTTFLENLSHEIRTPMNAIIGFTDLLLSAKLTKEEKTEYLKIINKSGVNLVSIIEDLIEMSKIETHQIVPNYADLNLDNCIREIYETIKINIPKTKNIEFYVIKNNKPIIHNIKTDVTKLKQIIINLLNNAVKFTDDGYVSFGYEIINENEIAQIKFTVKDTGIGIDQKHQKIIFDRFKRIESDKAIQVGGLGLGLAISKAYIEILGGTISLKPNKKKGSVFSFLIPLRYNKKAAIVTHQAISEAIKEKTSTKTKTILVAEDDAINFLLIKKMLQPINCNIIRAENGKIAVDICINNPDIDLVLMDIKMPIMNGYEAFEKINAVKPTLPIIAQTAYSSPEDKEKVEQTGFNQYITKPINKERLLELVSLFV